MGSIALRAPARLAIGRRARAALVVLSCLVPLAVYVLVRIHADYPHPTFVGACERIRAAGLAMTPRDWFCHPAPWTEQARFVAASTIVAVGFASTAAILAAAGHRWSAFLPLIPALGAPFPALAFDSSGGFRWWTGATWPAGALASGALTLLLLATPAIAIVVIVGPPRSPTPRASPAAGVLAAAVLAAPVVPLRWVVDDALNGHFAVIGQTDGGVVAVAWVAASATLFAVVLGTHRRWWPWSVVSVSLVLSMAPSAALAWGPDHLTDWSRFGVVLPLVVTALLASLWRPAAEWITRKAALPGHEPEMPLVPPPSVPADSIPRRLRPSVVLNATGAGLLIVSVIAFRGDPLPAQLAMQLPTYLGARTAAADVRTRMNLDLGIEAMDDYRHARGTYRGFDAHAATSIEPRLRWVDGVDATALDFAVQIVSTAPDVARLAAVSSSGNVYCMQRSPAGLAYGSAPSDGRDLTDARIRVAIAACGSTPWTAAALQPPAWRTMCDGVDDPAYMICRMVQVLEKQTLADPSP